MQNCCIFVNVIVQQSNKTAIIMTKEEFVALQLQHQQSGKSLKKFLQEVGVCYSKTFVSSAR